MCQWKKHTQSSEYRVESKFFIISTKRCRCCRRRRRRRFRPQCCCFFFFSSLNSYINFDVVLNICFSSFQSCNIILFSLCLSIPFEFETIFSRTLLKYAKWLSYLSVCASEWVNKLCKNMISNSIRNIFEREQHNNARESENDRASERLNKRKESDWWRHTKTY